MNHYVSLLVSGQSHQSSINSADVALGDCSCLSHTIANLLCTQIKALLCSALSMASSVLYSTSSVHNNDAFSKMPLCTRLLVLTSFTEFSRAIHCLYTHIYRTYPVPSDRKIPRTIPRAAKRRAGAAKQRAQSYTHKSSI